MRFLWPILLALSGCVTQKVFWAKGPNGEKVWEARCPRGVIGRCMNEADEFCKGSGYNVVARPDGTDGSASGSMLFTCKVPPF